MSGFLISLIFISQPVVTCIVMSFPEGPMESGGRSSYDENGSADAADTDGLFGPLRRFSKRWSRRYIEMRVDALESRWD
mgnify:FL=1